MVYKLYSLLLSFLIRRYIREDAVRYALPSKQQPAGVPALRHDVGDARTVRDGATTAAALPANPRVSPPTQHVCTEGHPPVRPHTATIAGAERHERAHQSHRVATPRAYGVEWSQSRLPATPTQGIVHERRQLRMGADEPDERQY